MDKFENFLFSLLGLDPDDSQCCAPNKSNFRFEALDADLTRLATDELCDNDPLQCLAAVSSETKFPHGPKEHHVPIYSTVSGVQLIGEPSRTGKLLLCKKGMAVEEIRLTLYENGFSVGPAEDKAIGGIDRSKVTCRSWSPFTLLDKCADDNSADVQSNTVSVFMLTIFNAPASDCVLHFGTVGLDSDLQRESWMANIREAISNVTMSLVPARSLVVLPLTSVPSTRTRIMAGYLLRNGATDTASLVYCELQSQTNSEASLAVYRDSSCELELGVVPFSQISMVCTRVGYHCTVFGIDGHFFAARTMAERDIWLRAVSNVKVKLMFQAPAPDSTELYNYRLAVYERIEAMKSQTNEAHSAPLLRRVARLPDVALPSGDEVHPEVVDEGGDDYSLLNHDFIDADDIQENRKLVEQYLAGERAYLVTSEGTDEHKSKLDEWPNNMSNVHPEPFVNSTVHCGSKSSSDLISGPTMFGSAPEGASAEGPPQTRRAECGVGGRLFLAPESVGEVAEEWPERAFLSRRKEPSLLHKGRLQAI